MIGNRVATGAENDAVMRVIALIAPDLPDGSYDLNVKITGFRQGSKWTAVWQLTGHAGIPAPPEPRLP